MYLYDPEHSSTNPNDTAISAANATSLKMIWSSQITNESPIASTIAAATEVVGDTAYVGDWDGNETAVNALTGQVLWQRFLGQTSVPNCNSPRGVTSSAAIYNGTVYVGGGADWWYALNATTGATEWQTYVGDSNASGGNYNWASPVIYNGYEYIGAASDCDLPLVRGELMQVSLTTHAVVHTFYTVPTGQTGGTVWTTPTFDPELNTIFVATGNCYHDEYSESPYCGGMVALNMSDISLGSCAATCDDSETLGHWQDVTCIPAISDCDIPTTPTLFVNSHGTQLVEVGDKNGTMWAFDADDLNAGPVWHTRIAHGGNLETGRGLAATAVFDGKYLIDAGQASIKGGLYNGSLAALYPDNGTIAWQTPLPNHQTTFGAVIYENGVIIEGGANLDKDSQNPYNGTMFVLNASSGKILWQYATPGLFYDSATVALGHIYIGNFLGTLYCFGPPQTFKITSFSAAPSVISLGNSTTLTVSATGGSLPYSYFYSGLPTGCLTANSSTLICKPTETGTFPISVQVTDSVGMILSAQTSLTITLKTLYTVTFTESGLPTGTSWSVTLNGSLESSTTTSIVFMESNGMYPYTVGAVVGYTPSPPSGTVEVSGAAVAKGVTFTSTSATRYTLSVQESGLPTGTNWSITVAGVELASTTSTISTQEANGTYAVTVGTVAGYTVNLTSFSITIAGASAMQSVSWSAVSVGLFAIIFLQTGLPSGSGWGVTLAGSLSTSTGSTITFNDETNGNYSFTISAVGGYTATPGSGTVHVQDQNVTQSISFSSTTTAGSSGLTTTEYVIIGVVVLVIAGCIAAVLLTRNRRRPPPPAEPAP